MKIQKIRLAGVFLLSALMLTGLNAQSQSRNRQGAGHGQRHQGNIHGQNHQRMAKHFSLDLSEEQKVEMKALKSEHYTTMKPLKNKMAELKATERTLLSEEKIEMNDVNKVIDEQTDLLNKIKKLQVEHQVNAKSVLTDEQVMKLEQRRKLVRHRLPRHKEVG